MHKEQTDKCLPAAPSLNLQRNKAGSPFETWQAGSAAIPALEICERRFKKKIRFYSLDHNRQYKISAIVFGKDKNTDCLLKYFKSAIFARPNGTVITDLSL